jgi:hypothetical protein
LLWCHPAPLRLFRPSSHHLFVMSSEHLGFFVRSIENQGPGAQSVNGALVRIFYTSGFSQGSFY